MSTTREAKVIAKKFNYPFPRPWKRQRWVWHPWHQGRLLWKMTYRRFVNRFVFVYHEKPSDELTVRYRHFRVVKGRVPAPESIYDGQYASSAKWDTANTKKIKELHKKEIPNSCWSYRDIAIRF